MLEMIAFDADDTLWHSECYYRDAQDRFEQIVAPYARHGTNLLDILHEIEIRNLPDFGYGIKGFALSMIEAAIQATHGAVPANKIQEIIDTARDMTHHEVRLLDHVQETVSQLASTYPLMLVTKGDLMDQERKISLSGLSSYFKVIEIVSDKTPEVYQSLLKKHQVSPQRFMMVGNSLRSDIVPVIDLGGWGVYVPYMITWSHEHLEIEPGALTRYFELDNLRELANLIQKIKNGHLDNNLS